QRDEVRPLRCDRCAPGQLHPPDVLVAHSNAERRDHLSCANHRQKLNPFTQRRTSPPQGARFRDGFTAPTWSGGESSTTALERVPRPHGQPAGVSAWTVERWGYVGELGVT